MLGRIYFIVLGLFVLFLFQSNLFSGNSEDLRKFEGSQLFAQTGIQPVEPTQPVQPSPRPVQKIPEGKTFSPGSTLPDLKVENIFINEQCNLCFTLVNTTGGNINATQFSLSKVQVKTSLGQVNSEVKEYTLQQIDPNHSLPRRFPLTYCTDMKKYVPLVINGNLPSYGPLRVNVTVDFNQIIPEANESNNELNKDLYNYFVLKNLNEIREKQWNLGETITFKWDLTYPKCSHESIRFCSRIFPWWPPHEAPSVPAINREFHTQIPLYKDPGVYELKIGTNCIDTSNYGNVIKVYGGIKLLSPKSGDVWKEGDKRKIQWEAIGFPENELDIYILNQSTGTRIDIGKTKIKEKTFDWTLPRLSRGLYKLILHGKNAPQPYYNSEAVIEIVPTEVDLEVTLSSTLIRSNPKVYRVEIKCKNKGTNVLNYIPIEWVITKIDGTFVEQASAGFSVMYPDVVYTTSMEISGQRKLRVWIDRQNIHRESESLRNDNYAEIILE